jgi:Na+-transporting methylmalonyl-CoA/oxaloacetate decarboxylase gamma subunit
MIKKFIVILVVVVGIAGALLKWEDNRERSRAAAQAAAADRARAQAVTHINVPHSDALNYNPFATPGTSAKSK